MYDPYVEDNKVDAVSTYWANYNVSHRASVHVYDSSYTFTDGIEPNTEYYVVLAHVAENELGDLEKTLDDYYRLVTPELKNQLTIDYVNTSAVGVTLVLESLDGEPRRVSMTLGGDQGSAQPISHELTPDELKAAASGGVQLSLPIGGDQQETFTATEMLGISLRDDNDKEMLVVRCTNSFYKG